MTLRGLRSLPSSTSRFNSRPTRKKKIAIRPSLIQSRSGLDRPSPFSVIVSLAFRKAS
jgi:hypothetical protein